MKTVKSRSTDMGATRYTAILIDRTWHRVSHLPNCHYLGKCDGVSEYAVEVADDTVVAHFYRNNQGLETVTVEGRWGLAWASFAEAHRWALGGYEPKTTCPHCGREM